MEAKRFQRLDPYWQGISASRREGTLYVKMSRALALSICSQWTLLIHEHKEIPRGGLPKLFALLQDEEAGSSAYGIRSVFYSSPVDECKADIEAIDAFTLFMRSDSYLVLLRRTLELGLESDPSVDWIARVGGGPEPDTDQVVCKERCGT